MKKENYKTTEYDSYLKNLLKLVKKKGILAETMKKGTSFLGVKHKQYKANLGAVTVKNIFGDVTNVYVVYEDYDGSIKYYDYPQITYKYVKRMLKERKILY